MLLYCIRHGQSIYNAEGRIQGQSDVPLSPLGRRQSEAVAAALARLPIDAIYASPLQRAMQTAQPLADARGLEIQTDLRLKEIDTGVFQDKIWDEIAPHHPEVAVRWRSGDIDIAFPGGESRRDLMRRGPEAFRSIFQAGHEQAVVVSHGGLLVATLKVLLDIPPLEPPLDLENGSITKFAFHGDGQVELLTLDEVDHLEHLGMAVSDE